MITGITPPSIAANAGDTAAFTVTSTGDAPSYYWYKETAISTNLIPSATTATLTLVNLLATNTASYQVVLSNASGMATSSVVTLTVVDPYLTTQPISAARLAGSTGTFSVGVLGSSLSYQWYVKPTADNDFTGSSPLSNGGRISGATTNVLNIANLVSTDATNLFVVITNTYGAVTSSVVTLSVANFANLALWNFNGNLNVTNPSPAQGVGTATFTNCTTFSNSVASGLDFGSGNNAWGSSSYPTNGNVANNKTAGLRFNVSTLGAKNIGVTFDARGTATASKYFRLQYTTNGTDFIDYPTSSALVGVNYQSLSYSLSGFPNVLNNPSFGIRVATEFESTAKYGATNNANYVGITSSYATSGTFSLDLVTITGDAITNANAAPTVSAFSDIVLTDEGGPTNITFTVGDDSTPAGSLTVDVFSDNTSVISGPSVSGATASRTLTITPTPGQLGAAPIRVIVTDANGDQTTTWFYVTVIPSNFPPTISGLSNTNMLGNITSTFAFTVGDDLTPVGGLTVSAFSGNTTLVPNDVSHLTIGGSGANRTVIVTPATSQYGVAPITITVNDGQKNTVSTFILVVRPNTVTPLVEGFDYDASGAIINVSGAFWQTHSGTAGQMQVGSGAVTVTDAQSEDVFAPLIGQPFTPASKQVLYSKFTLNYSSLPTEGGTYFAHFKDGTTSGFFGRVYASTLNAAPGFYRLGIGNSSGVTNTTAQIAQDLALNTDYTIVTRLVLSNGVSTIWINPANEASPSMTDTTTVASPGTIAGYALRQSGGEGTLKIDNLKIALNFISVLTDVIDVPPLANPDGYSITGNSTNNVFSPLTNDVLNMPNGALSIVSVSPTNGTATIIGTNVLFSPTTNFAGTATIGYTITDGFGGLSTSLITVTVSSAAPTPEPITIQTSSGKLVMSWTQANFFLASSTNVSGPYVKISGATSPYTNSTSSGTQFFRLVYP